MASFGQWISLRREEYTVAITSAYNNRNNAGALQNAWNDMVADSSISGLLPPGSTAFWKGSGGSGTPTAGATEITAFQAYLANPDHSTHVSSLGLSVQTYSDTQSTDRNTQSTDRGSGDRFRRWKGQPLYTFANGMMVGKAGKIVALFGNYPRELGWDGTTGSNADYKGFGTDGLIYFDGIRFSKGTTTPGVAVFGGDLVCSGSIQGSGGVVIIDDVIQLETGVNNPAAIALSDTGKILLRHRGQGFLDFIDEDERMQTVTLESAKLWVGEQNTASTRLGSSIIPNSNFETKETYSDGGTYTERPAGPIVIGNTNKTKITYPSGQPGILSYYDNTDSNMGILLPAVAINDTKYVIRIRVSSAGGKTGGDTSNGLFVEAHEYNTGNLGAKSHVYHSGTTLGIQHEGYASSTYSPTVQQANAKQSLTSGGNGLNLSSGSWNTHSFVYTPGTNAEYVSIAIYSLNTNTAVYVDYVTMNAVTVDPSEVSSIISDATDAITAEAQDSTLIANAGFDTYDSATNVFSCWEKNGNAILSLDQGDGGSGDNAIKIQAPGSLTGNGDGIISKSIERNNDRYNIGFRVRPVGSNGDQVKIKLKVYESHNISSFISGAKEYIGPSSTSTIETADNALTISTSQLLTNNSAVGGTIGLNEQTLTVSGTPSNDWVNIMGTYSVTYSSITGTETPPTTNVNNFSVAIEVTTTSGKVLVDYVFLQSTSSSINLATELANQAYGDSQVYISEINQLVSQEQGSLIPNAAMGTQQFVTPDGGSGAATHVRPSGFRYASAGSGIAANHWFKLAYVAAGGSIGKDSVMEVIATSNDGAVITPPWTLESDRYSIIVRARAKTGTVNLNVVVNYSTNLLEVDKATIADVSLSQTGYAGNGTLTTESDVQTSSVNSKVLQIDDVSNTQGGTDAELDWEIGPSWENVTVTWDRGSSDTNKIASLTIRGNGNFYIDYILVSQQTVSYNLAESVANTKKQEAIDASVAYSQAVSTNMVQEAGSLMPNAAFAQYVTIGGVQRPAGYYGTMGADIIKRLIKTSPSNPATSPNENVLDVGQTGDALEFGHTGSDEVVGILCPAISLGLPTGSTWGSNVNSITPSSNGQYAFVVRIRSSAAEPIGVSVTAHELYGALGNGKTHCYFGASSNVESAGLSNTQNITGGTGQTQNLNLINITTADTSVGDGSFTTREIIPVDTSEEDGDTDQTASTYETWYDIGGTYTAAANTRNVCFEIAINSDVDSDNTRAKAYVDYIYFAPQTFDANFADSLAAARKAEAEATATSLANAAEAAANNYTDSEVASTLASATALVNNLRDETGGSSLLSNSFFFSETTMAGHTGNHKRPEGFTLYNYDNVGSGGTGRGSNNASDRRTGLLYDTSDTSTDRYIRVKESAYQTDLNFSLLSPAISPLAGKSAISVSIRLKQTTSDNIKVYIRSHQLFSSLDGSVYSNCAIGTGVRNHSTSQSQDGVEYNAIDTINNGGSSVSLNSVNSAEELTYLFTPSHFDFKPALVQSGAAPEGTWYQANVIDIGDTTDKTDGDYVQLSGTGWHEIGGTIFVHQNAHVLSLEFYFEGVNSSQGVIIDSIVVADQDPTVDLAAALSEGRLELADDDDLEDEDPPPTMSNSIANPTGKFVANSSRNSFRDVPASWKYLGQNREYGLGYMGGSSHHRKKRKTSFMSLLQIGTAGVTAGPSDNNIFHGAMSKPFRIKDNNYEVNVTIKGESVGQDISFIMYEYTGSTDLSSKWITPGTVFRARKSGHSSYQNETQVASSKRVNASNAMHLTGASSITTDYLRAYGSSAEVSSGVKYRVYSGTTSTNVTSAGEYYNMGSNQWHSLQFKYIPSSTTVKWAALGIIQRTGEHWLQFKNVEVLSDGVATSNEYLARFAPFDGKSLNDVFLHRVAQPNPASLYGGLNILLLTQNATSVETPSVTNTEISIHDGRSAFTSTTENSTTIDENRWNFSQHNINATQQYNRPDTVKWPYENTTDSYKSRAGGLIYAKPQYYYNRSSLGAFNYAQWHRGISYYYPEASDHIGINFSSDYLWLKSTSDNANQLVFFDNNSTSWWSFYFGSNNAMKFKYNGTVAAYIASSLNNESLDFTGQHRSHCDDDLGEEHVGLIVVSKGVYKGLSEGVTTKPGINEALPVVELSSKRNQKSCYGVISNKEEDLELDILSEEVNDDGKFEVLGAQKVREYSVGNLVSVSKRDDGDERLIINSVGEGGIWVCNINGNLENGDYITTCEIPGLGMLQDDDILHNYTVAKITQDCNFRINAKNYDVVEFVHEGKTYRKAFVGCTYHCG